MNQNNKRSRDDETNNTSNANKKSKGEDDILNVCVERMNANGKRSNANAKKLNTKIKQTNVNDKKLKIIVNNFVTMYNAKYQIVPLVRVSNATMVNMSMFHAFIAVTWDPFIGGNLP